MASLSNEREGLIKTRGRVVIEPIRGKKYDLDRLVSQMTPDTFHDPIDFCGPVGDEIWWIAAK